MSSSTNFDEIDEVWKDLDCPNPTVTMLRLMAAQLIVLRKIEFAVSELLVYKQREVHT